MRKAAFSKHLRNGVVAAAIAAGALSASHVANANPPPDFTIVALGDSIMWGQGLAETHKFVALTRDWFKSNGWNAHYVSFAHSGATLLPKDASQDGSSLVGEVPDPYPSIQWQEQFAKSQVNPSSVDLILLDGGINDSNAINTFIEDAATIAVALINVGDARSKGNADMAAAANMAHDRMKTVLTQTLKDFPKATVIVTGYMPIASRRTKAVSHLIDAFAPNVINEILNSPAAAAAKVAGMETWIDQHIVPPLAELTQLFAKNVNAALTKAVAEANAAVGGTPRALFADPTEPSGGWSDNYAYGADGAAMWSGNTTGGDPDEVASARASACASAGQGLNPLCLHASFGHPNVFGAKLYSYAIQDAWKGSGRAVAPSASASSAPQPPPCKPMKVSVSPAPSTKVTLTTVTAQSADGKPVSGTVTVSAMSMGVMTPLFQFPTNTPKNVALEQQLYHSKPCPPDKSHPLPPGLHPPMCVTAAGLLPTRVTVDAAGYCPATVLDTSVH